MRRSEMNVNTDLPADALQFLAPAGTMRHAHEVWDAFERPPELAEVALPAAPDAGELSAIYQSMTLARALATRVNAFAEQHSLGLLLTDAGYEASTVASAHGLRAQDWLFPSFRDVAAAMGRGMPLERYVAGLLAQSTVLASPGEPRAVAGRQVPGHFSYRPGRVATVGAMVGSRLVHGIGLAWAAKMRADELVSLIPFSESESHSDGFHNGLNFAGVFKAPALLLCRNDRWSGGLHAEDGAPRPPVASQARKGIAYGIPALRCDGNDPVAILQCIRLAQAYGGPLLIDALVTPLAAQIVGRDRDPLKRSRLFLESEGIWDATRDEELQNEVAARIDLAWDEAEKVCQDADEGAEASLVGATMMNDVFALPPWHLREQRAELLKGPRPQEKRKAP